MSILPVWTNIVLLAVWFGNTQGYFVALPETCNITSLHPSVNVNCSIIDKDKVTIYFNLLEPFAAAYGNLTFQMDYRGAYVTVLEFTEVNFCRIHSNDAPPALRFFKEMRNKPNLYKMPQYCPIKVGDYYMKNIRLSSENVPLSFPALRYRTAFSVYVPKKREKVVVMSAEMLGRIRRD